MPTQNPTVVVPRVSAVVPAFNAALTLRETVRSVLDQSEGNLEVLIVNDGSIDDTVSVARSIDDARVRVIEQENRGVAAARNTGIREARGRYVAFLDSDDMWAPKKLERQLAFMERGRARATQTAVLYVDHDLQPLHIGPCPPFEDSFLEVLLFRHLPAFPSTLVLERAVVDEIGLFDETLPILEDWEFAVRLARHNALQNLDEPLTMYRIHPGNRSRNLQIHVEPGLRTLEKLFADPGLPRRIREERPRVYAAMFTMLSGGALRARDYRETLRWGVRAVRSDPSALRYIAAAPARRAKRALSRFTHRQIQL